jgi:ABC-type glycerol-3-phosphate transport system substrate-binding protein
MNSMLSLRNILLGVGLFGTIFAVLIFSGKIQIGGQDTTARGEVQLWGIIPDEQMNPILQSFNPQAKTYAIRYTYVPEEDFNQRLLEALASGTGPDLIFARYQTILAQEERIFPFPTASLPEKTFRDTFVDGATILFGFQGAVGLPVTVDPLVLFYNRSILSRRGIINPPTYWDEVGSLTPTLTARQGNRFIESAIALGTPNTPYAKDIIMAIVTQLGQSPVIHVPSNSGGYFSIEANTPVGEESDIMPLATTNRFFTQFGDPGQKSYTWTDSLGDASTLFVGEKLAMYIGYASEYGTLRARNPRADFGMTYLPQTRGYNTFSTGMKMYAVATLKSSKNLTTALTAQSQLSGSGVAPSIAAVIGASPALRSYAATQGLDPVVARSMLVARGWYDSHENGSTEFTSAMISDIINYRYGVSDASSMFVARMRDLYSKK